MAPAADLLPSERALLGCSCPSPSAQGPPTPANYSALLTANLNLLASPTREGPSYAQSHLSPCAHAVSRLALADSLAPRPSGASAGVRARAQARRVQVRAAAA